MGAMELRPDSRGKVRDIYDCGDSLLMVASDRISAFDVILPDEIPHKGEVLTRLSALVHPLFRGLALPFEFNKHTGKDAIYRNASLATNCHSP